MTWLLDSWIDVPLSLTVPPACSVMSPDVFSVIPLPSSTTLPPPDISTRTLLPWSSSSTVCPAADVTRTAAWLDWSSKVSWWPALVRIVFWSLPSTGAVGGLSLPL